MARLAAWVVLLYEADIAAEVDRSTVEVFTVKAATGLVLIVKVPLVLPAGMVTLEGTLAAPLLLESATCAPATGAGPLKVTVPVEDCAPPVTLVGFSVT